MNKEVVESKLATLEQNIKDWDSTTGQGKEDYSEFTVFLNWAKTFCQGSKIEVSLRDCEEAVEDAKKDLNERTIEFKRSERLLKEVT